MNSEADVLTRLHNIVLYIKWKATDDPWLADAVKYLESDLVYHDEEYRLVASQTEPVRPWEDCYFEEDWDEYWDESDWCSGSIPCEENCDAEWGGCQWLIPPVQGPAYHTWEFRVGDTLYQLNTPQMTLFAMDRRSQKRRVSELTAEAILDVINLMIVAEITEI